MSSAMLVTLMLVGCTPSTPAGSIETVDPDPRASEAAASRPTALESPPTPEPTPPERVAIRHVLIAYAGAEATPFGVNRSRAEARHRAGTALNLLQQGTPFAEVAKDMSDDASRSRGGFLGSGEAGTWVPAFEAAAFSLAVHELSAVVESPFGFHVLRRDPLEEVRLRHLVVQFAGTPELAQETPPPTRSRDEALQIAQTALAALEEGRDFADIAADYSDGPMGLRGADLGWFLRGELGPSFDEAAFGLEVDAWSSIVETPFGLHIIQRVE